MTDDNERKPGREEITRCTMKPHRLTCINPPGTQAGRRTEMPSARAAGQKDEHPGTYPPGPEPPLRVRGPGAGGAAGETGTGAPPAPSPRMKRARGVRGHPPWVAIGEAMRKAKAGGLVVFSLEPAGELPFHFVTVDGPCISLVRVRRLKYPGYTVEEIGETCKKDIAALRSISVTAEIFRELRVRGPDRHWYRYLVLPASVEVLEEREGPEGREETGVESPVNLKDAVEPVKDTGTGDTPVIRLRPEDPGEPDDRAETGDRSASLQAGTAGAGTP